MPTFSIYVILQNFRVNSKKEKKGNYFFLLPVTYGFFLSINRAKTIATTMIKTNRPAIAGTKYMSATDVGVAVGVGVTVVDGALTTKLDSEYDG